MIVEHRAQVEAQVGRAKALREAARAAPAVTGDTVLVGERPIWSKAHPGENVAVEYLEDLDDLTALGNVPVRIEGSGTINGCAAALATHRAPYDPMRAGAVPSAVGTYEAEGLFRDCERLRYVFVVRSLAYAAPSEARKVQGECPPPDKGADAGAPDAGGSDGGVIGVLGIGKTCSVFDGGYLRAEVLVFELSTAKLLGGFRFEAESSARIDVGSQGTTPDKNFKEQVRAAFVRAAVDAIPTMEAK